MKELLSEALAIKNTSLNLRGKIEKKAFLYQVALDSVDTMESPQWEFCQLSDDSVLLRKLLEKFPVN